MGVFMTIIQFFVLSFLSLILWLCRNIIDALFALICIVWDNIKHSICNLFTPEQTIQKSPTKTSYWNINLDLRNWGNVRLSKFISYESLTGITSLDLHGMTVAEATKVTNLVLKNNRGKVLLLVTGRGNHSEGGRAIVKPAIQEFLLARKINATELNNGGLLKIKVPEDY
ncbi:unnamed protein product [Meganyctiphanes norvegica]|uniref:Smr domain-containing protein n=1 Tax=Meganyctiphanes norvegica TaxID=48144 RepID=A0AAV2SU94_MEGNR